jgi:hypothetical protein
VIDTLKGLASGWGRGYLRQWLGGRFRFPEPGPDGPVHLIMVVANHFEPLWNGRSLAEGRRIQERWCRGLEALGVKDGGGRPFRHTYFFPAEQYHPELLQPLAEHCAAGFGEIEVHLHHGLEGPDTPEALERQLREFTERLLGHGCLARDRQTGRVGYCFVHGDWALANSAGGPRCGVDSEMAILARTGCYLDCTLPSAPGPTQVPVVNAIYQCARPLTERAPHRRGIPLRAGQGAVRLPMLLQGPLLLDWSRRVGPVPVPRLENGDLTAEYPPTAQRFRLWASARVAVQGRPEWVFIKLHTHGLIERHLPVLVGEPMQRFLDEVLAAFGAGLGHRVHFATAREAANMILAAVAGERGDPGSFRDYRYLCNLDPGTGPRLPAPAHRVTREHRDARRPSERRGDRIP